MSQLYVQALATDEAETICKLEKRNFDLVELQKKLEEKMETEREKLKRGLDNAKKEGELLKILVNELHREIEGKDDQIKEIATQLAEAKDDVLKLEEANSRLKGQVLVCVQHYVDMNALSIKSMNLERAAYITLHYMSFSLKKRSHALQ